MRIYNIILDLICYLCKQVHQTSVVVKKSSAKGTNLIILKLREHVRNFKSSTKQAENVKLFFSTSHILRVLIYRTP